MECKYKDFFTEYDISILNLDNLIDKRNKELISKIPGPMQDNSVYTVLKEIHSYFLQGIEHKLYEKYKNKYCDSDLSNILVPYLENNTIKDLIIISNPEDSQYLAKIHRKKNPKIENILLDSVLSTTDVQHWRNQRDELIMPFIPNNLEKLIPILYNRAIKSCEYLNKYNNANINISNFFLNETQAQLQLALFGVDSEFEKNTNKKIRNAFSGKGEKGYVRKFSLELIENIKNNKFNGPLSKALLNSPMETDTELYGNAILFTFAGHDTTGHTLTWLIYELSKNLNIQSKLQKEVDNFFLIKDYKNIKLEDFELLPYMKRCIAETLRLWPAVANGTYRELLFDDYITINNEDISIPKGTYIQIPNIYRHRSKELWGYDALIFNPDRDFLDKELWYGNTFSGTNMESERYSPFSFNPRSCLGKSFAHIEMRIILLVLLKEFTFLLPQNSKINEKTIEFNMGTMGPRDFKNGRDHSLLMNIQSRKSKL